MVIQNAIERHTYRHYGITFYIPSYSRNQVSITEMPTYHILPFFCLFLAMVTTIANTKPLGRTSPFNKYDEAQTLDHLTHRQASANTGKYTGERCDFDSNTCEYPRMCREHTYPNFKVCKTNSINCFCFSETPQYCTESSDCLRGDRCYGYENATECFSCNNSDVLVSSVKYLVPVDGGIQCTRIIHPSSTTRSISVSHALSLAAELSNEPIDVDAPPALSSPAFPFLNLMFIVGIIALIIVFIPIWRKWRSNRRLN